MSNTIWGDVSIEHYDVNEEDLSSRYINNNVLADFNLDDPDIEALGRVIRGNETVEELESDLAELREAQVESTLYKGPGGPFRTSVVNYPISNSQIASGVASRDVSLLQATSDIWNGVTLNQDDEEYPSTRVAVTQRDDASPLHGDLVQAYVDLHPSDDGRDIEESISSVFGGRAEEFGEIHDRLYHFEIEPSKN